MNRLLDRPLQDQPLPGEVFQPRVTPVMLLRDIHVLPSFPAFSNPSQPHLRSPAVFSFHNVFMSLNLTFSSRLLSPESISLLLCSPLLRLFPLLSMSHPLVAAVWEQLGRHDVANILREIMGEHAAELAVLQVRSGLVSSIEPVTRMVFWVKAIFDLQRTYLQGVAGVADCHPYVVPYLLSSEMVYSTLMYLVRVKSELFPSTTATILEFAQYRYFLAQTLLAGVRVLLLRGEGLLDEMKGNLEHAIRVAWNHPGLSNAEQYLVNNLLPGAIGRIGSSEVQDTTPSGPTSRAPILPAFVSGLVRRHIFFY